MAKRRHTWPERRQSELGLLSDEQQHKNRRPLSATQSKQERPGYSCMVFSREYWCNSHITAKNGKGINSIRNHLRGELGTERETIVMFVGMADAKSSRITKIFKYRLGSISWKKKGTAEGMCVRKEQMWVCRVMGWIKYTNERRQLSSKQNNRRNKTKVHNQEADLHCSNLLSTLRKFVLSREKKGGKEMKQGSQCW